MKKIYENVIFLDFDEVVNNVGATLALDPDIRMDPVSVGLLVQLIKDTDGKVVVTSTWRFGCEDVDHFKEKFRGEWRKHWGTADFDGILNAVVGLTPWLADSDKQTRGREIAAWFEKNEAINYVIIDDACDFLPEQRDHIVRTQSADGFRLYHMWKALKMLVPDHKRVKNLELYFQKIYEAEKPVTLRSEYPVDPCTVAEQIEP